MEIFDFIIAQASNPPWWVATLTGSGGVAILSILGVTALWKNNNELKNEIKDIAKESVETITLMLEKTQQEEKRQEEIRQKLDSLLEHVKISSQSDENWKRDISERLKTLIKE